METTEETLPELISTDALYASDRAALDVMIVTAKQFPRNVKRVTDNAIATVTLDQETAATCTYSLPRGGKAITGPSVHLAKVLAQLYGNLRMESRIVSIEPKQITAEAVCFDIETNTAYKASAKRSILNKHGMRFPEDMILVTGAAASSIAMRNAILSVIPRGIVEKVYKAAMAVITGDVSDAQKIGARRKQVVDALRETYSVSEKEILSVIGKASIDHITADDLVVLIGVGTSIKDGETSVEAAFRAKPEKKDPLQKTEEQPINVKQPEQTQQDNPHTEQINADAGKPNQEVEEKEKSGKKKDGKLF